MKGKLGKKIIGLALSLMLSAGSITAVYAAENTVTDPAAQALAQQMVAQIAAQQQAAQEEATKRALMEQLAALEAARQVQAANERILADSFDASKPAGSPDASVGGSAQEAAAQQALLAQIAAQQQAAQIAAAQQAAKQAQQAALIENGTYVDVSIDTQTLTYFVNGAPVLVAPTVTGSPGRSTPRGVFAIDSMIPGKYLTGPTWHVYVNRWMRFSGNCGIHDANWRKSFGGEIYKHNGSHGCVNIPYDQAVALYNMVAIGTPVIVH